MTPEEHLTVGSVATREDAERLARELRNHHIPCNTHCTKKGDWRLSVLEEADLPAALEYYRVALGLPAPPPPPEVEWERAANSPRGPITYTLMAFSIACWLLYRFEIAPEFLSHLFISDRSGGPLFQEIATSQWWRLFTPMFLHFHFLHIVFNVLWLHLLGHPLEHNLGRPRYLVLILVCAGASNLAQYLQSGPLFGGLSGLVYALVGLLWSHKQLRPEFPYGIPRRDAIFMLLWFLLCLSGLLPFRAANMAHAAGVSAGIFFSLVLARQCGTLARLHGALALALPVLTWVLELRPW